MLTLHQHGPHMTPLTDLPAPYDKPLFPGKFPPKDLDDWLNLNLGNYLERLQQSDRDARGPREIPARRRSSAVLMHFGDHQPSFDGAIHVIPKQVPAGSRSELEHGDVLQHPVELPGAPQGRLPCARHRVSRAHWSSMSPAYRKTRSTRPNTLLRERCKGRYLDCKGHDMVASYHDYVFNTLQDLRE